MHGKLAVTRRPHLPILFGLGLFLTLAIAGFAQAAPLPSSSPLYNPGAPIVENPEVSVEYTGTISQSFEYPPLVDLERRHRTAAFEWAEGVSGAQLQRLADSTLTAAPTEVLPELSR
jgi:hypothetical protein